MTAETGKKLSLPTSAVGRGRLCRGNLTFVCTSSPPTAPGTRSIGRPGRARPSTPESPKSTAGRDSVPDGEFLPQLTGRKPRQRFRFGTDSFAIDYPPLGLAAWGESWRFFTAEAASLSRSRSGEPGGEVPRRHRRRSGRGRPVRGRFAGRSGSRCPWPPSTGSFRITWVSSAVLGFFDGFVPPFLLVSLLLTGAFALRRRSRLRGDVPDQAHGRGGAARDLLAAPRPGLGRGSPLGGALVTVLVFLPFALRGHASNRHRSHRPALLPGSAIGRLRQSLVAHRPRRHRAEGQGGVGRPDRLCAARLHRAASRAHRLCRRRAGRRLGPVPGPAHRHREVRGLCRAHFCSSSWGVLTIGVHDNHNHPLFLLLVATGLRTPFLRVFTAAAATSTLLGSVCLHGLGRYYGTQWRSVLPLADSGGPAPDGPGLRSHGRSRAS